jgi:hypothetical protein
VNKLLKFEGLKKASSNIKPSSFSLQNGRFGCQIMKKRQANTADDRREWVKRTLKTACGADRNLG